MPVNITDVDTFTDPIVAPADSDPADRTYVLTIAQGLANRTRNLQNRFTENDAITWRLSPWIGEGLAASASAAPTWLSQVFGADPNEGQHLVSGVDFAVRHVPISDIVPDGATVTRIKALVKPGAARVSGRMVLELFRHLQAWTAPYANSFVGPLHDFADNGTTDEQPIDTGIISLAIDRSAEQLVARLVAGDDAGTNRDRVLGWEIQFSGPRYRTDG